LRHIPRKILREPIPGTESQGRGRATESRPTQACEIGAGVSATLPHGFRLIPLRLLATSGPRHPDSTPACTRSYARLPETGIAQSPGVASELPSPECAANALSGVADFSGDDSVSGAAASDSGSWCAQ